MSEDLEQRGLTVEQVRADATAVCRHFGSRKIAADALQMSVSHLHHLFGAARRSSPELLVKLYGLSGSTLRPELATANSNADIDADEDLYGGLTVAELIRNIERDIDETTGMLTSLKQLAEGYRHVG